MACHIGHYLAAFDRQSLVIKSFKGNGPLKSHCCVFVHYDNKGIVREHTRHHIVSLRKAGFSILFVTNSKKLANESLLWLVDHCALILIRKNRGYDFAAYRDGISAAKANLEQIETLIIANDSVYGPFGPLDDTIRQIDFAVADVWGLTDSWQHNYHLQSFFVAFGPVALASPAFDEFWQGIRNSLSKWAAINYGELRMTPHLQANNIRCRAIWSYLDIRDRVIGPADGHASKRERGQCPALDFARERFGCALTQGIALNPSIDLWAFLLESNYSFLKRELLLKNPSADQSLYLWHEKLKNICPDVYQLIIDDIKSQKRGGIW
jgi:hypothetical protein